MKEMAIAVFGEAQFELYKWPLNEPVLEVTVLENEVLLKNNLESSPEKP